MMPIVTMFAGPNGSGKSTLTNAMLKSIDLGKYINPDEIAAVLAGDYDTRVRRAQAEADRLRDELIDARTSFSFETVMSHRSKIDILLKAKANGFQVLVYFIATENPEINVARVRARVELRGHDVPRDKIIERYHRSLTLLPEAILVADRTVLFDNSVANLDGGLRVVAIVTNEAGTYTATEFEPIPQWAAVALAAVPTHNPPTLRLPQR